MDVNADRSRLVVVDASVALKWHLRDEDLTKQADALLEAFERNLVDLAAPSLIEYEIVNALRSAVLKRRLSMEEARSVLRRHQKIGIKLYSFSPYTLGSLDLSAKAGCSVYDASYAVLANSLGVDLMTGDLRLVNRLMEHVTHVRWIGVFETANLNL